MSDRSKDVAEYVLSEAHGPVLTSSLLTIVDFLNSEFIELLLAERAGQSAEMDPPQARVPPAETLPADVLRELDRLEPASRSAVSNSPFTLYAMRFDDATFWSSVLQRSGTYSGADPAVAKRCGSLEGTTKRVALCQFALIFVWYVLASSRTAARLLFALPDPVAEQLQRTSPWQLKQVAVDYPGLLTPRWSRNPAFWPNLVNFAATGDTARLRLTRLLGQQLIALDLRGGPSQKTPFQGRSRFR